MAGNPRVRKVADRIKEVIAQRLDKGLRDPRLGFVTITDVQVTGDLQHASIFYTVLGTDQERADSAAALRAATGMLRTEVGRNLNTRLTPSIEFILDGIPENAASIEALLREARERDAETESMAATAEYAGDPDPYVKPRDVEAGAVAEGVVESAEVAAAEADPAGRAIPRAKQARESARSLVGQVDRAPIEDRDGDQHEARHDY